MKLINLNCPSCGTQFSRGSSEYNRSQKIGRPSYCSRACSSRESIKNNIPIDKRATSHLNPGNKLDEYSPYRWHLRNISRRGKQCNLTLQDLKELWEEQGGICPYTGWNLKNMSSMAPNKQLPLTPDRASLDRIDSSKGYVKGNVQYVCFMAQCCKNVFSTDEVKIFCKSVCHSQA